MGDPSRTASSESGSAAVFAVEAILIAAAVALALFPPGAVWVERIYSTGVYPLLQARVTSLSNRVPFAVCDVLAIGAAVILLLDWALRLRSGRGRRGRAAARALFDTAAAAALLYLAFMGLWGFNYRRIPLLRKLDYEAARVGAQEEERLARLTIEDLNADSVPVHRDPWPGQEEMRRRLRPSFEAVLKDLGSNRAPVPAVPKVSLSDPYLGAVGISGFTNPFGLEVIFNTALLPVERPFTLAHEWAHVAGFADESEANFIALLTCARSADPAVRYSGWLALYPYLTGNARSEQESSKVDPPASNGGSRGSGATGSKWGTPTAEARPPLAPEVQADLRAIQARVQRRLRPALGHVESKVYDRFLKANAVKSGIASYGLFVELLLGTRFGSGWVPVRRARP